MGSDSQFELAILNRQREIARVQDELESFARTHAIDSHRLHEVQLAVEEHLTNIVRYAHADEADHEIHVTGVFQPGELRIEMVDDGRPFDPLQHPAPDLSLPIEERPIGGLGIHMIRKSVDSMEHRREAGRNHLLLVKKL